MPVFTDAQRAAIETRGCDLLVSAAAGSGKTTALTERIIRRIEEGGDIGRMLVVTFSRASAADMKKKITKALRERAEAGGGERFLRQLSRAEDADIKTIHSFCLSIVRANFAFLGLAPNTRIPDDAEAAEIRLAVMDEALDWFYENDAEGDGDPERDIVALADQLAGGARDEGMQATLLDLYEKTSCTKRGFYSIADSADMLSGGGDFFSSPYGRPVAEGMRDAVVYYERMMEAGLAEIAKYEDYSVKYRDGFEGTLSSLSNVREALGRGFEAAAEAVAAFSAPGFKAVGGEKPEGIAYFAAKKNEAGKFVRTLGEKFFSTRRERMEWSARRTASVCRGIVRVLTEFERRYNAEKKRRSLVDYSDLEHMALSVLSEGGAAAAVAAAYDDIFVDEYQDVNEVQDEIIALISRDNRFLVGDVKQAIYGFRGAAPGIFGSYRERIKTVYMSENFRCDAPVVSFTNAVCEKLLPHAGIPYGAEDALRHAKNDEGQTYPVRVLLTGTEREAELAAEIAESEIAAGRDPSEIAILLRSAKTKGAAFCRALKARGIPFSGGPRTGFFESPEIMLSVSLLHVCDNPLYDFHLAAVLRSPVFGFDMDELTRIKADDKRPLWRVLADGEVLGGALGERCLDAYETIKGWREASRFLPADEALRLLTESTGLAALLWSEKNGGGARSALSQRNLDALYELARGFEAHGFRGVHRFITHIDSMKKNKAEVEVAAEEGSGVRVLTVHKSKGLEFPVVILAGCGSARNERDAASAVLWSGDTGTAMKLRADEEGNSTVMLDTPQRQGVAEAILERGAAEEMRILYVALTRARERLFVVGAVKDAEKALTEAKYESAFLCRHTLRREKTYLGLILAAIYAGGTGDVCEIEIDAGAVKARAEGEAEEVRPSAAADPELVGEYRRLIEERLSYRYPYERLGALPAKLSVSRLMPDILDGDATEFVAAPRASEPGEAAKAGTATHLYMQFCDYALAAKDARAEGERLLAAGYITKEDFDRIRFSEVETFFASELYRRIERAEEVWRERRFNVRLPAADFTENEADRELYRGEELLVQGVIDCFFRERGGGIVLLDYKTDRLSPYELSHPEAADEKLVSRHARQLSYYAAAIEKIFGERPSATVLYSMCAGRGIAL